MSIFDKLKKGAADAVKSAAQSTAANLAKACQNAKYLGSFDEIARYLLSSKDPGLLLIMGAGSIVGLTDQILTERKNYDR